MRERIVELRKILGLTQQQFGDKLGIKRGTVANYEVGRNLPSKAVMRLI
ncbi:MAG: helix-turn-helix transcriptional regulator [Lachnospiraceae bacterium]|nr:helix-turn-helix transcriptional regulator [Lachnospiraceae bacterium]